MTTAMDPATQTVHRRRFKWRGAVGIFILGPAAAISLFSMPLSNDDGWLHVIIQAVAWMTFLAGGSLRFWATLYVGGRKERELVIDGPFSVCRNPLYVGSLLLGASAALFLESPVFLVAVLFVAAVYTGAIVPAEEAVLRTIHGQQYDAYCRRVPRYWPRELKVYSPAAISVDVDRLRLECARAARWIWLPILGGAVTHLRAVGWWPKIFPILWIFSVAPRSRVAIAVTWTAPAVAYLTARILKKRSALGTG